MVQQGAGGEQRCLERICDALLKTFNEAVRYRNERLRHVETRIVQFFINAHDESRRHRIWSCIEQGYRTGARWVLKTVVIGPGLLLPLFEGSPTVIRSTKISFYFLYVTKPHKGGCRNTRGRRIGNYIVTKLEVRQRGYSMTSHSAVSDWHIGPQQGLLSCSARI